MTKRYKEKYGAMHKGMLWLQDVPDFKWVYLHIGNTDDHTEGCILVGDICEQNITERGRVGTSAAAYQRVYPPIAERLENNETVWISVGDIDGDT